MTRYYLITLLLVISPSLFGEAVLGSKFYQYEDREDIKNEIKEHYALKEDLKGLDSFYDEKINYARFSGRVTDRDKSQHILKVSSENKNIKFFRAGDKTYFNVATKMKRERCLGYVRSVEDGYFVIYVKDFNPCFGKNDYFRRGSVLVFNSFELGKRVRQASLYRSVLLRRRRDFFKQLNEVNHFIWSYEQQKIKTVADYDREIAEIEKRKQLAIDNLINKKKDSAFLQRELVRRLDELDKDLDFYRVERNELMVDRWHLDHDSGVPVGRRPQKRIVR